VEEEDDKIITNSSSVSIQANSIKYLFSTKQINGNGNDSIFILLINEDKEIKPILSI
jgi:hypothetical protein